LKTIIFVSETLSLFFGNTFILQKNVNQKRFENKRHMLFWSWPMRARDEHWTGIGLDWIRTVTNFVEFGLDPDCK